MTNKLAVGYVRASTDDQAITLEAQRASLTAWCATNGYTLVSVHEDAGVSGTTPIDRRPGLLAAMADVAEFKAEILLVTKRDRLARDVIVGAMVERMAKREGAVIRSVDGASDGDGPEAQLMRRMIDAFAEYECLVIRARTRIALAHKRARGESIGPPPYGFKRVASALSRKDGQPIMVLTPDAHEQEALRYAYRLIQEGWTPSAIGRMLVHRGYRPRNGKDEWNPKTIRDFLAAARELCDEAA